MRLLSRYGRPAAALLLLAALAGWAAHTCSPHTVVAAEQGRLDAPTPWLEAGRALSQSFRSAQPHPESVSVYLVLAEADRPAAPGTALTLRLERLDAPGTPPLEARVDLAGLRHNDVVTFRFAPLDDPAGATYRATFQAEGATPVALWASRGEAYASGAMAVDGTPQSGDLAFRCEARYAAREALADLAEVARRGAAPAAGAVAVLIVPGWALEALLRDGRREDPWVRGATVVALSVSCWALLALWGGALGARLVGIPGWVIVGLLAGAAAGRAWWRRRRETLADGPAPARRFSAADACVLLALAAAAAGRALNVRALVAPAWVDSVHHTVLTRLIADTGGVPSSYSPYLPVDNVHYHFGFHAAAAALASLTHGDAAQAVLVTGQALSALAPLAAYALAARLTRRRWAGAGAALVAASLSYLPAYYASWGRYTHLAGLVMLPAACLAAARALRADGRRQVPLAALLAAGLGLTHYRVLLFYVLAWPFLIAGRLLSGRLRWRRLPAMLGRAAPVAAGALLAAAPWIGRFVRQVLPSLGSVYGGWQATPLATNTFSPGLVTAYWGRGLLVAAAAGLALGLARHRWRMAAFAAWVGTWFLVANLHLLGLRDVWLLDNEAVLISVWLPLSTLCGSLAAEALGWLRGGRGQHPRPAWLGTAVPLAATALLAAAGTWAHLEVVNPVTVLVTEDDLAACAWIREHTPQDALFLVNARDWQGDLVVGTDGGYWLPLLADRRTTVPCVFYHHGPPEYRAKVTDLVHAVDAAPAVDDPALLAALRQAGVTHVYVGARGGRLLPRDLDGSPHYRALYAYGPVRVYALNP